MSNTSKRMAYFSYESQTLKYFSLFSDSKCRDEVYFASQKKKVDVAIYPFKIFIKSSKCKKKRQEICRNFQELRFTYSHF